MTNEHSDPQRTPTDVSPRPASKTVADRYSQGVLDLQLPRPAVPQLEIRHEISSSFFSITQNPSSLEPFNQLTNGPISSRRRMRNKVAPRYLYFSAIETLCVGNALSRCRFIPGNTN